MKNTGLKKIFSLLFAAILVTGAVALLFLRPTAARPAMAPARLPAQTLVIDAGHGGEDGGAVSLTGMAESHINLAIARRMDAIAGLYGVRAVMLREEDTSLHSPGADTLRQKKTSDLQNRVAMVEGIDHPVLISIHQNIYTSKRYAGAQVFYADAATSAPLAAHMQEAIRLGLAPENNRQAARISTSVYLLDHVTCPAVIVECGFLSNPAEEALLRTPEYQVKLAAVLAAAYFSYEPPAP